MADSELVKVGALAPDFSLPNAAGATVRLADALQNQIVILYFMREFR